MVVHNGIVENYVDLKRELEQEGHKFVTETDTEIIAHLVENYMKEGGPLEDAVRKTVRQLTGVYSLVFLSATDPKKLWRHAPVRRRSSAWDKTNFSSPAIFPAILAHTRDMFFLADGDIAVLTARGRARDGPRRQSHRTRRAAHHLGPDHGRKGRLQTFHAEGNLSSSPAPSATPCSASVAMDSGKVFLDKMDISEQEFRDFQQHQDRGLRNQLARRA